MFAHFAFLIRHYGDLGNVVVSGKMASVNKVDSYVELDGTYSVIGRSIVVSMHNIIY